MYSEEQFQEYLAKAKTGDVASTAALLEPYNSTLSDLISNQLAGTLADPIAVRNDVLNEIASHLSEITSKGQLDQLVTNIAVTSAASAAAAFPAAPAEPALYNTGAQQQIMDAGMFNTGELRFDPQTGQPLANTGMFNTGELRFDPETGQPLNGMPNVSDVRFDPNTGQPIGNTGTFPVQQPVGGFDPNTGRPLGPQGRPAQQKSGVGLLIALCAVLVVGLIGICVWWFLLRDTGSDTTSAAPVAETAETLQEETAAIPDATPIPEQTAEAVASSIPDVTAIPDATAIPDVSTIPDVNSNVIGRATIIIRDKDTLRKRTEPSTRSNSTVIKNNYANYGEVYDVYDVTTADGYTWYEIGDDVWVADKSGKWISYQSY